MKTLRLFILVFFPVIIFAQEDSLKEKRHWLKPDYAKMQFAGNIGFLSTGVGYHLFNKKLYTELLYGHVPKSISKADKIRTITLKNTFPIYRYKLNEFTLTPISGFTGSVESGNNSFIDLPSRFPDNYYSSNAFHVTVFVGGMMHKDFENSKVFKGFDFYYEVGTVGIYLWYAVSQNEVSMRQSFSSSIGFNLYF